MSRLVRCGLIQASNELGTNHPLPKIKKAMIDKLYGVPATTRNWNTIVAILRARTPKFTAIHGIVCSF